jgi:phosphoglucosamine mutase
MRGSLPHGYRSAVVRRYFGTDGVRGVVGDDLTEALVERLGLAFALWSEGEPVLIGRDTRGSGPALEGALARGLVAGGSDAILGGILPTPAVALLAESCGVVVSASHNPAEYNGLKFFGTGGSKLGDDDEEAIEALLGADPPHGGEVRQAEGLEGRYVDLVCERFGAPLDGLRLCVDCANGARRAGATWRGRDNDRRRSGRNEHQCRVRRNRPRPALGHCEGRCLRPGGRLRR